MRQIIILLAATIATMHLKAQNDNIVVTLLGNAGLRLSDGERSLYIDFPYRPGAYGYMKYDENLLDSISDKSIFLFTHGHADHYNRKRFRKTKQKLFAPWPIRIFLGRRKKLSLSQFNTTFPSLKVTPVKTSHKLSMRHYSYLIEWHNKRIYVTGDTENADSLLSHKKLDAVFLTPWVLMDAKNRNKALVNTQRFFIYHRSEKDKIRSADPGFIVPEQNQRFVID